MRGLWPRSLPSPIPYNPDLSSGSNGSSFCGELRCLSSSRLSCSSRRSLAQSGCRGVPEPLLPLALRASGPPESRLPLTPSTPCTPEPPLPLALGTPGTQEPPLPRTPRTPSAREPLLPLAPGAPSAGGPRLPLAPGSPESATTLGCPLPLLPPLEGGKPGLLDQTGTAPNTVNAGYSGYSWYCRYWGYQRD